MSDADPFHHAQVVAVITEDVSGMLIDIQLVSRHGSSQGLGRIVYSCNALALAIHGHVYVGKYGGARAMINGIKSQPREMQL